MIPLEESATGIVASVGRSFCKLGQLSEGIRAGALNFRIALGLDDRPHFEDCRIVREAGRKVGVSVAILLDLPSSRPRVGPMPERSFEPGEPALVFDCEGTRSRERPIIPLKGLQAFAGRIRPGHRVFFRDGRQQFRAVEVGQADLRLECISCSEPLQTSNACSFPDSDIVFDVMRSRDREVLESLGKMGIVPDWVAPSLVTSPGQVEAVREALEGIWPGQMVRIMAKIETAEAVARLGPILDAADGCLVGRGDLGLTMEPVLVPRIQQKVACAAAAREKPFAVATQMLERFAETGVPYRAELSDVALGVRQRAAGLVLCAETSNSERPIGCIELMRRIIEAEMGRF